VLFVEKTKQQQREELEQFFFVFSSLYPAGQGLREEPLIEDEDYLREMHNLQVPYLQRAAMACSFRAFVQTENGRMGLAPLSARLGDEIWNLKGAKIPFILRPQPDGGFKLIGEAYVHGIMQGEVFEEG